jgi:hypothetical protein
MSTTQGRRLLLLVALLAAAIKGTATAVIVPAFQAPDEYGHYDYVLYLSYVDWGRWLAGDVARPTGYNDITTEELWFLTRITGTERHLRGLGAPQVRPLGEVWADSRRFEPIDTFDTLRTRTIVGPQFNYPPLYYGLQGGIGRAGRWLGIDAFTRFLIARGFSLVLGLLTVAVAWWVAGLVFPDDAWARATAALFVALQPQLTLLTATVQSDAMSALLVCAAPIVVHRYARRPATTVAVSGGLLIGALLLTKLHAALAVGACFGWACWSAASRLRVRTRHLAVGAGVALLTSGWWYLRAWVLYDSATGMVGTFRTAMDRGPLQNLQTWAGMWPFTWRSLWGRWGWLEYGVSDSMLACVTALTVVTLLLAAAGWWRQRSVDSAAARASWAVAAAYAVAMVCVAAVIGPEHNNQGRHWLPLVAGGGLLVGAATAAARRMRVPLSVTWIAVLVWANLRLIVETVGCYGVRW